MSAVIDHETQQPIELVTSKTTTALAVVTKSIEEINAVEKTVSALEKEFKGVVYQIETTEGMREACKARATIREPRYALQKMQKEAKVPLNDLKRAIDEQAGALIERITAVEDPVHTQIANEEARKEAEKKAKAEAEEKRKAAIEERINDMRESVALVAGRSAADIAIAIGDIESVVVDQTFGEFQPRAETAKAATLVRLRGLHTAAVSTEAEAKRLEQVRLRLAQEKVDQDAAAANERDRQSRLTEIAAIRNQVVVASVGRKGAGLTTRVGGTIDCIRETLDETHRWPITDERFGAECETARNAKADAVRQIEELLKQAEAQAAEAKRLADQKAEQDARDAEATEQQRQKDQENERLSKRNEMSLQEISAIQHQLIVAESGRSPYCKGGDLHSYDWVIAETERWTISEDNFGALAASAQNIKNSTLATLRKQRADLVDRMAREADAKLASDRLAAQQVELDRQNEALRIAQQPVQPEPDAIITAADIAAGPIVVTAATQSASISPLLPSSLWRPKDEVLIQLYMTTYAVSRKVAIGWILDMAARLARKSVEQSEAVSA